MTGIARRLLEITEPPATHCSQCCRVACAWLRAQDRILAHGQPLDGPTWVRDRWKWGWGEPGLSLCSAIRRPILSCGTLASIDVEVALGRGLSVVRCQTITTYAEEEIDGFRELWRERADTAETWLAGHDVYHVLAVVILDGALRVWDASGDLPDGDLGLLWASGRIRALRPVPENSLSPWLAGTLLSTLPGSSELPAQGGPWIRRG